MLLTVLLRVSACFESSVLMANSTLATFSVAGMLVRVTAKSIVRQTNNVYLSYFTTTMTNKHIFKFYGVAKLESVSVNLLKVMTVFRYYAN